MGKVEQIARNVELKLGNISFQILWFSLYGADSTNAILSKSCQLRFNLNQ